MFTGLFIDTFIVTPFLFVSDANLTWDIASDFNRTPSVNVLSELEFNDIRSKGIGIKFAQMQKLNKYTSLYYEVNLVNASISDGKSQDSDYFSSDRNNEFSRSTSDITGDEHSKTSLMIGLKSRWFNQKGNYFSWIIGYEKDEMNLRFQNGVQVIPESLAGTELTGLNSTYYAENVSYLYGFSTEHVYKWGTIGFRYLKKDVDFNAVAQWNLRSDFEQPESFKHSGQGKGQIMTVGYTHHINFNWDFYANYSIDEIKIKNGFDLTNFSDGTSISTRLNTVDYKNDIYEFGFRYIF